MEKLNTKYQGLPSVHMLPASIFMEKIETNFLDKQEFKSLVWFQYINDVFFIWTHGKEKNLRTTTPTLNLSTSSIKNAFPFWALK